MKQINLVTLKPNEVTSNPRGLHIRCSTAVYNSAHLLFKPATAALQSHIWCCLCQVIVHKLAAQC